MFNIKARTIGGRGVVNDNKNPMDDQRRKTSVWHYEACIKRHIIRAMYMEKTKFIMIYEDIKACMYQIQVLHLKRC